VFFFGDEVMSFDTSLVLYVYTHTDTHTHTNSTNIPPIMIINRIYEHQNLLSL
jgi:hypothetical protein